MPRASAAPMDGEGGRGGRACPSPSFNARALKGGEPTCPGYKCDLEQVSPWRSFVRGTTKAATEKCLLAWQAGLLFSLRVSRANANPAFGRGCSVCRIVLLVVNVVTCSQSCHDNGHIVCHAIHAKPSKPIAMNWFNWADLLFKKRREHSCWFRVKAICLLWIKNKTNKTAIRRIRTGKFWSNEFSFTLAPLFFSHLTWA